MLFRDRNKKKGGNQQRRNVNFNNKSNVQHGSNDHQSSQHQPSHHQPSHQAHLEDNDDVRPMEIDNTTKKKKYSPLSKAEKQRRKDLNLCSYCGSPDHDVIECDLTPPRKQSVNANSILRDHPPTKGNSSIFTFEDFLKTQS
ncbi:hypothetical protein MBANPS3_012641, partial [Mucor bainieri]